LVSKSKIEDLSIIQDIKAKLKEEDTTFCIISNGRSGSNFLASLLEKNSNVSIDGEEFLFNDLNAGEYISSLSGKGFRFVLSSTKLSNTNVISELQKQNCNIVLLYREDIFARLVSYKIAQQRDTYIYKEEDETQYDDSIEIKPIDLMREVCDSHILKELKSSFGENKVYELDYKDISGEIKNICSFLNIQYIESSESSDTKITPNKKPLHKSIKNFDDVIKYIKSTHLYHIYKNCDSLKPYL
jgi:hypothetical protein